MIRKITRTIDGRERRRGVNLLQALNAALSLAVLVYVQQVEHRMTAVETKVDILMRSSGIEIPDYLRQDRDRKQPSAPQSGQEKAPAGERRGQG